MKNIIKIIVGFFLSLIYNREKDAMYLFVWGHIGEVVYTSSLLPELKVQKNEKINILTFVPYNQIVELYKSNYNSCIVLSKRKFDCIRRYALSDICIQKNFLGAEWKWEDVAYYVDAPDVYIPGFNYKVSSLTIPYRTKHALITDPISYDDAILKEMIVSNNIEEGKSVLIIPYAQTAKQIDKNDWADLILIFVKKGYKVFTNVKDEHEDALEGTVPIRIPLKYICAVAKYMGVVLSIRCGLTDLLAVSDCEMEVIYKIDNQVDKVLANIWTYKLGKENILYRKKWFITSKEDILHFQQYLREKY